MTKRKPREMKRRKGKYEAVIGVSFGGIVTYYAEMDDLRFREKGEQLYRECTLREAEEVLPKERKRK